MGATRNVVPRGENVLRWAAVAAVFCWLISPIEADDKYTVSTGFCRPPGSTGQSTTGGNFWGDGDLWECIGSYTLNGCAGQCDAYTESSTSYPCAGFDISLDSSNWGGTSSGTCCLFRYGNTGDGDTDDGKYCYMISDPTPMPPQPNSTASRLASRNLGQCPTCNSGYTDVTGCNANWWSCGNGCVGGTCEY